MVSWRTAALLAFAATAGLTTWMLRWQPIGSYDGTIVFLLDRWTGDVVFVSGRARMVIPRKPASPPEEPAAAR